MKCYNFIRPKLGIGYRSGLFFESRTRFFIRRSDPDPVFFLAGRIRSKSEPDPHPGVKYMCLDNYSCKVWADKISTKETQKNEMISNI